MGQGTKIEWADDTINPTIGCEGCELWQPQPGGRRVCYAGRFIESRMAGRPGWPARFEDVLLKPGVMSQVWRWKDLTGTDRPDKPWLDRMPRLVFVDDLGDLFSKQVPFEFIADEVVIPAMQSPHILQLLTKRPGRALEFCMWLREERGVWWPNNVWLGTSITSERTLGRLHELSRWPLRNTTLFLSIEPVTLPLPTMDLSRIAWVILGGESGPGAPALDVDELFTQLDSIWEYRHVRTFVKQLGSNVTLGGVRETFKHPKGGDWSEWPQALRHREMPVVSSAWARRLV